MPIYSYQAREPNGSIVEGKIEAESERLAFLKLRDQGLFPIAIKWEKSEIVKSARKPSFFARRVSLRDLALLSRQFSTMLKAGMTIIGALDVLIHQTSNRRLKLALTMIKKDVEEGNSLSESLAKHKDIFDELYISLIRAGETGGVLDEVLDRLAFHLERENSLIQRVKTAMRYPIFILSMAIGVILLLVTFVVPRFITVLEVIGVPLSLPTILLISFVRWFEANSYVILIIPFALWVSLRILRKNDKMAYLIDKIKIRLPIIGQIIYKVAIVRVCRTLATLSAAAVPILESLDMVANVSGNELIKRAINFARLRVREGQGLAESILISGVFPPMVTQMMAVGEETGKIDEMLHKVADFFDEEIDNAIKGLSSMIEPVLVLLLGGVVGFIAISVFMPLFQLIGGLAK